MTKIKCPHCDSNIDNISKFCKHCGKELETGLTHNQKEYLKKKKTAHTIGAVGGSVVGGVGLGLGMFGIIGGIILIIIGILLSITIIGAIIGIPLIIIGITILGAGGASTVAGGLATGAGIHSAKKTEEIDDQLKGIKKY